MQALDTYPGAPPPENAALRFQHFFRNLDTSEWETAARELYAESLYFNDTLFTTDSRDGLLAHFARVRRGTAVDVVIDDAFQTNNDLYLRWRMVARFKAPIREAEAQTIGMTLLRFNEQGRIVFHQDFWDSTEGFFRHLPVLGSAITQVRNRFTEAP